MARLDPLRVDNFAGDKVNVPGTIPELINLLYGIAPGEKDGILNLLDTMEEIYRAAMSTPPEVLYAYPGIKGVIGKYREKTYKELLDEFITSPKVRAVMCDRCAFLGLPPSKVSALAMTIMFMTYSSGGGYRINGGACNLTNALVKALLENGGELHLNTPVSDIMIEDGKACGVFVAGGTIRAGAVIYAADAEAMFRMSGTEPGRNRPSISFYMVYLGLKGAPEIPDSMGYYPGYDIESTFADAAEIHIRPERQDFFRRKRRMRSADYNLRLRAHNLHEPGGIQRVVEIARAYAAKSYDIRLERGNLPLQVAPGIRHHRAVHYARLEFLLHIRAKRKKSGVRHPSLHKVPYQMRRIGEQYSHPASPLQYFTISLTRDLIGSGII